MYICPVNIIFTIDNSVKIQILRAFREDFSADFIGENRGEFSGIVTQNDIELESTG